jgi:hypothetical protein
MKVPSGTRRRRRTAPAAMPSPPGVPGGIDTFVDAMDSPDLFGPWFRGPSWNPWREVARAMDGQPVHDVELFHGIAGAAEPPTEVCRELWAVCGRRGGKSQYAAARGAYEAVYRDYSPYLKPGERGVVMLVAGTRDQAKVLFGFLEAMFDQTALASLVVNRTRDSLELSNGITIKVQTCSFRGIRGRTCVCVVFDEAALWVNDQDSRNADRDVLAAVRPSMATIPNARLIVISSPWAKRGIVWDAFHKWYGRTVPGVLVIRASTEMMNSVIDRRFLDEEREKDPVAYRAEYDAFFRDDLESFISVEMMEAVVQKGRGNLPPQRGRTLYAFLDTAGGGGGSSVALAIAMRHRGKVVLVALFEWAPPFDSVKVAREIAERLRQYGIDGATGDHFSGDTWPSLLKSHGIRYRFSKRNKSQLLHDFLPLLTGELVELPDHQRMVNQALALERSTSRQDQDSISAPPNGHDDLINAVAGACLLAQRPKSLEGFGGEDRRPAGDPTTIREELRYEGSVSVIYRIFPDGREIRDRIGTDVREPEPYDAPWYCRNCSTQSTISAFVCPAGGPPHEWCRSCGEQNDNQGRQWCPTERAHGASQAAVNLVHA